MFNGQVVPETDEQWKAPVFFWGWTISPTRCTRAVESELGSSLAPVAPKRTPHRQKQGRGSWPTAVGRVPRGAADPERRSPRARSSPVPLCWCACGGRCRSRCARPPPRPPLSSRTRRTPAAPGIAVAPGGSTSLEPEEVLRTLFSGPGSRAEWAAAAGWKEETAPWLGPGRRGEGWGEGDTPPPSPTLALAPRRPGTGP